MKVKIATELMKNQKHAQIMAPDKVFEVLQTPSGEALFFSIGTDDTFYVTRELVSSQAGWTKVDLSSRLSALHGNSPIKTKKFDLSQNPVSLKFDLVLAVTVAGSDFLYVSIGNESSITDWEDGVSWTAMPFDAEGETANTPLSIGQVYLMNIPTSGNPVQNCFADVERDANDPLHLVNRYYFNLTSAPHWRRHALPIDLKASSISTCLGRRSADRTSGVYTFGSIEDRKQLIFAPQRNIIRPDVPPSPSRLLLPADATAISSVPDGTGNTNLFVAARGGLYLYTPDNQKDQATATLIVGSPVINDISLFGGVSRMVAHSTGSRTMVWCRNAMGELFYMACERGQEATADQWSLPVPLHHGVEEFAFYTNIEATRTVVFAQTSGQQLVRLTQDASSGDWNSGALTLPPTDVDHSVEYESFTTQITSTLEAGDDAMLLREGTAVFTATSPVSVHINNEYYVLDAQVPVSVTADVTGSFTIIQQTQSLSAVQYQVTMPGSTTPLSIDPLKRALEKMALITSGEQLDQVSVPVGKTSAQRPLIPSGTPDDVKDAVVTALVNLLDAKEDLPVDGSVQTDASREINRLPDRTPRERIWGLSYEHGCTYLSGKDATVILGRMKAARGSGRSNVLSPGDFFQWLQDKWDEVKEVIVERVNGVWMFICKIGDAVYEAVLNCVNAIVAGIEFIFNKIQVFFEDLKAWLGFIFGWDDMIRTQKVMKNMVRQYVSHMNSALDSAGDTVEEVFEGLEDKISAWAGLPDNGEPIGNYQRSASSVEGTDDPQVRWGSYHVGNGASSSEASVAAINLGSGINNLLDELKDLAHDQGEEVKNTVDQIKTEVIDQLSTLTPIQVIKKLTGLAANLLVSLAKNLILGVIEILKSIVQGIMDILDTPLRIPVISKLYKTFTGNDLSILDVACLVAAVPATIIYKAISNQTPFPDDNISRDLIEAPSFPDMQQVLNANAAVKTTVKVVFNIAAYVGAGLVVVLGAIKEGTDNIPVVRNIINGIFASSFLIYVGPSIAAVFDGATTPHGKAYNAITAIAISKTMADSCEPLSSNLIWGEAISPVLETVINVLWIIPTIGLVVENSSPTTNDYISLAAGLASGLAGSLAFIDLKILAITGPVKLAVEAVAALLTMMYGVLSVLYGGLLLE
ncbi:hypothetical protein BJ875DRAFT_482409 [Amylocarpus encephaloides]|uniref:Uncharacterized protein n=1 Tax=Amylocarpus encephaloides TaxID=45428 RepID=A0A9P7YMD9_9HELO|nr:hypothetical protein BJ875DRAFT_482409 [Amylocarpus encephaloides]